MVEPISAMDQSLYLADLVGLPGQVFVQLGDRLLDHLQLMDQEVGGVPTVRLGLEKNPPVQSGCRLKESGDWQKHDQPVAAFSHQPKKEDARGAAVAVDKWMVIGEPEVHQNGSDDRVDKGPALVVLVCELA